MSASVRWVRGSRLAGHRGGIGALLETEGGVEGAGGVVGRGLLRDRAGWASVGRSVCLSARGRCHRSRTATES